MKRRVIKQGHNTLTLTIPSEWAKRFNLIAGSEIDVIEKDNGLFLSTQKNGEHKKVEFDISGMDIPTIWKHFMAVYREGYDEIVVKFTPGTIIDSPYKFLTQHRVDLKYQKERSKKDMIEAIQGFVSRFIGIEIVEHGKDYVIIKEMGDITSKEFDNSLRRVFLLIQQMAEEALQALKTNNYQVLEHTHDVDITIDKFHDYCVRILNKNSNKEARKTSLLFATLYILELLADEFKNISHHLVYGSYASSKSKFKNILPMTEGVKEQIDTYYDLFYKFDRQKIEKLSELDRKTYLMFPEIYKKASEEEKEIYHHFRMIERYINALTELRIEMEF